MSYQEKVTPGKVNNLISFFENQGDENSKPQGSYQVRVKMRNFSQVY